MATLFWLQILTAFFLIAPVRAAPVYTVGVEDVDLSPILSVRNRERGCLGYACEVLNLFARNKKIQFRYVPFPVSRTHLEFWNGKVDFVLPDHPSWSKQEKEKRNLKITYSNPLLTFQDAVLIAPERLGQGIDKIKTIGTIRGFTIWKLQPLVESKKLKILGAPKPESSIQMALAGRVDAVTMPLQIANYHLKQMNRVGALVPDPSLLPIQNSFYYLSTIRYPELIEEFNAFLKREESQLLQLKQQKEL